MGETFSEFSRSKVSSTRLMPLMAAFACGLAFGILGTMVYSRIVYPSERAQPAPIAAKDAGTAAAQVSDRVAKAPSLDLIFEEYRQDSKAAERKYNNGQRLFFYGTIMEIGRSTNGGWQLKIRPMMERGLALCTLKEFDPIVPRLFAGRFATFSGVRWLSPSIEPGWVGLGFEDCKVEKL